MRRCLWPDCPALTSSTYCATHTRAKDRGRGTKQQRGYGGDWPAYSRAKIASSPRCVDCGTTVDLTVDHPTDEVVCRADNTRRRHAVDRMRAASRSTPIPPSKVRRAGSLRT